MQMSWDISDKRTMAAHAGALARQLRDGDVVLLIGDLAAGKTTFTKAVAAALGYTGDVTSPTFNIMQEYAAPKLLVHHVDLYRLDDPMQLEDIGFYEAVDVGTPGAALIEWADLFPEEMPDDVLAVHIRVEGDKRRITAEAQGPRSEELLRGWSDEVCR